MVVFNQFEVQSCLKHNQKLITFHVLSESDVRIKIKLNKFKVQSCLKYSQKVIKFCVLSKSSNSIKIELKFNILHISLRWRQW